MKAAAFYSIGERLKLLSAHVQDSVAAVTYSQADFFRKNHTSIRSRAISVAVVPVYHEAVSSVCFVTLWLEIHDMGPFMTFMFMVSFMVFRWWVIVHKSNFIITSRYRALVGKSLHVRVVNTTWGTRIAVSINWQ
jgi:hypothetical protein